MTAHAVRLLDIRAFQRCGLALFFFALAACSQLEDMFGPDHEVVIAADFAPFARLGRGGS